ncbi:MAG: hypothetical protein LBQ27_05875 [Clostridiales bacterium]|jgi:hypothetical protein|nr:hypothetical protein [Clostridiales bacterium]
MKNKAKTFFAAATLFTTLSFIFMPFGVKTFFASSAELNFFVEAEERRSLLPGEVRILTERVYFLEKTLLEYETYGGENIDSVVYSYGGYSFTEYPTPDGDVYILVDEADGEIFGEKTELMLEIITDSADIVRTYAELELIFYDVEFFNAKETITSGGSLSIAPTDILSVYEIDASDKARLIKNFKDNTRSIKVYADENDVTELMFSEQNTGAIDWSIDNLYESLYTVINKNGEEYSKTQVKLKYRVHDYIFEASFIFDYRGASDNITPWLIFCLVFLAVAVILTRMILKSNGKKTEKDIKAVFESRLIDAEKKSGITMERDEKSYKKAGQTFANTNKKAADERYMNADAVEAAEAPPQELSEYEELKYVVSKDYSETSSACILKNKINKNTTSIAREESAENKEPLSCVNEGKKSDENKLDGLFEIYDEMKRGNK